MPSSIQRQMRDDQLRMGIRDLSPPNTFTRNFSDFQNAELNFEEAPISTTIGMPE